MELSKENLAKLVQELTYKDLIKNKEFYSLTNVIDSLKICSFDTAKKCALLIKEKLINISYPSGATIQLITNSNNDILDVCVDRVGFMLVMAEMSNRTQSVEEKNICQAFAKYLRTTKGTYYPMTRAICRLEYSEVTKKLTSTIKQCLYSENSYQLSEQIALIYHTILSNYYCIKGSGVADELNKLKTEKYNRSYLDYITARELKDLTEIQRKAIYALKNTDKDILTVIMNEAHTRRMNFFTNYAHKYPEDYPAHLTKPAKLIKDFDKILMDYKLDIESLNSYEK